MIVRFECFIISGASVAINCWQGGQAAVIKRNGAENLGLKKG
jgi:hypothetical protein